MQDQIEKILKLSEDFLRQHAVGLGAATYDTAPLTGEFSLHRGQAEPDLYGMIDAVYILYTIRTLQDRTDLSSRKIWAERILSSQDANGWFTRRNIRRHSPEHATAYSIAALKLLELEPAEDYLIQLQPLNFLLPILTDYKLFECWINRLGFRYTPKSLANKNLGWHHIWHGSHVGGGIGAIIGMTQHLFEVWWPGKVDVQLWFRWYIDWLNTHVNPETGYWQRAFWNVVYRKPTLNDMGGAVHFYWVYAALGEALPYPERIMLTTLNLQRITGLYKNYPFCIDLDGNFCVIRSYLQLPPSKQQLHEQSVYQSVKQSFSGVVNALTKHPLEEIYPDSHGLPGALAALVECTKLPNFKYSECISAWKHPLDHVWWL